MIHIIKRCAGCCVLLFWSWCLVAQPTINRVEYYIDKDPGFGKATSITITPGTNLSNISLDLNPGTISYGAHILGFRAKDAAGHWSLDNKWILARPFPADSAGPPPLPNLVKVEYYIDKDPGFGKATQVSISPGTNLANLVININPADLTEGVHVLGFRSQDSKGRWSLDNKWLLGKPYLADKNGPGAASPIELVEYYIDKDPGFGKGTPVAINQITNLSNINLAVNVSGLAAGAHILFIRSKNVNGKWSLDNRLPFGISSVVASPSITVNSISNKALCGKDSVKVGYQVKGTFNAGNVFKVQLSDANGAFGSPIVIGSYTGVVNSVIRCAIPDNLPAGTRYKLRVVSTNPVVTGFVSVDSLTTRVRPAVQVIAGDSNVNVTFTYPYSVPAVAGSTWKWIAPDATIIPSDNTASLTWNNQGQPKTVKVYQIDQYGCKSDTSKKNVNVYALRIDSVKVASLTPCPGATVAVTAKVSGVYKAGNIFTAQLSDSTGSFANPVNIGTLSSVVAGKLLPISINAKIPVAQLNGKGYRIRITSSVPVAVSSDNGQNIIINKPLLPSAIAGPVTVSANQANLTYSVTNVTGLTYAWKVPVSASITSGQGTSTVKVKWGAVSDSIKVSASNTCGISPTRSLKVNVSGALTVAGKTGVSVTDIDPEKASDAIKLYPNPTSGLAYLQFNATKEGKYMVEVRDATNKLLVKKEGKSMIGKNTVELNAGSFIQGIYFVTLTSNEHLSQTVKLVKLK